MKTMHFTNGASGTGTLVVVGLVIGVLGLFMLFNPQNLANLRDSRNLIWIIIGTLFASLPEGLQRFAGRVLGLGFITVGALCGFAAFSGEGESMPEDPDAARVHLAAEQVELMDDAVAAKFGAYCNEAIAAANGVAAKGLKAEMSDKRTMIIRDASNAGVLRVDLYRKLYKGGEKADAAGKAVMFAAIKYLSEESGEDSGAAVGGSGGAAGATPAAPAAATLNTATPNNATPTPIPGPTVDPKIAAIDRLLDKAAKQWAAGKKDASVMLAEEALKDAEAHLPAGHPKIEEVKKKVEGAHAALKAP